MATGTFRDRSSGVSDRHSANRRPWHHHFQPPPGPLTCVDVQRLCPPKWSGKCPSRPLSYHRTVIRGTCPWCASWAGSWLRRLADRVPVDAQLPGDCPNGEAPKLSLLHGLPPNPLSRRGFPAWRCRRLANSAAAVQCGAVGLDGVEGCQALLGVAAHAVDPTLKAGAISERTIGGT